MNIKVLPFLIARLTAVYFLYQSVIYLATGLLRIAFPAAERNATLIWTNVGMAVLLAGVFFAIWKKSEWLAIRIMGNYGEYEINTSMGFEEIQNMVFSGIGFFLLATTISFIARDISMIIAVAGQANANLNLWPQHVEVLVRLLVSFGLIFGPGKCTRLLRKIRGSKW